MQLDAAPDAVGDTAGDSFGVMASSPSPMLAFSFFLFDETLFEAVVSHSRTEMLNSV